MVSLQQQLLETQQTQQHMASSIQAQVQQPFQMGMAMPNQMTAQPPLQTCNGSNGDINGGNGNGNNCNNRNNHNTNCNSNTNNSSNGNNNGVGDDRSSVSKTGIIAIHAAKTSPCHTPVGTALISSLAPMQCHTTKYYERQR